MARELREERGLAEATIARRLSCLAGFYGRALDERLLARNPVARVRRPRVGEDSPRLGLSRAQAASLLEAGRASGARDFLLVALLFYNGLRVSEALALDFVYPRWDTMRATGRGAPRTSRRCPRRHDQFA